MGFFTFTFADRTLRKNKYGGYHASCKLQYDGNGKGYIAYPNGSFSSAETYYEGYGIIAEQDVFLLVAEWNKSYLEEILKAIRKEKGNAFITDDILTIAIAWQNNNKEMMDTILKKWEEEGNNFEIKNWKRTIGISIVCEGNNDMPEVRFPLKITATTKIPYKDLPSSISTQ